jgi:Zn-dependent peptidase ImmA (M78 family)
MPARLKSADQVSRSEYYRQCRTLAQLKRALHCVQTDSLNLVVMQNIYRAEGISIDRRKLTGNRIRAAYYCDDNDCSVLVEKALPKEPKLFALAHELKHHYMDRQQITDGEIECGDYNAHEVIEKGAEVFAAEFIYPEAEMLQLIGEMRITNLTCTAEKVVEFKRECRACVSYTFIVKRFTRFGLCQRGVFDKVKFTQLEEQLFGVPIYKQDWFQQYRSRRNLSKTKTHRRRSID